MKDKGFSVSPAPFPPAVDVAIIGGGFAGTATAYFLGKAGLRHVAVLEREPICGAHASGRNAALCRQLAEDDVTTELTIRGAAFLRRPPAEVAPASLVTCSGSVLVASREASLDATLRQARRHDLPHELVSPAAIVEHWPLLAGVPAVGGVHFPTDGVIDVHALLTGYIAAVRRAGGVVVTGCEVRGVARDGDELVVETGLGALRARAVVVAAGAWADPVGEAAGARPRGFAPFRRHLFVTAKHAGVHAAAPWVWHLDEPFYVRPEAGALLISGCDGDAHEPTDVAAAPDARARLAEQLTRLAPRLSDLPLARAWACLRTFAPGHHPVIRWDEEVPGLFWVAGLGGHGATASASVGALAAVRIFERLGRR